jgi:hypothetical protein
MLVKGGMCHHAQGSLCQVQVPIDTVLQPCVYLVMPPVWLTPNALDALPTNRSRRTSLLPSSTPLLST